MDAHVAVQFNCWNTEGCCTPEYQRKSILRFSGSDVLCSSRKRREWPLESGSTQVSEVKLFSYRQTSLNLFPRGRGKENHGGWGVGSFVESPGSSGLEPLLQRSPSQTAASLGQNQEPVRGAPNLQVLTASPAGFLVLVP